MSMRSVVDLVQDNPETFQVLLFASIMAAVWWVEKVIGGQSTIGKLQHTSINAIFMSGALPVQLVMMLLCVTVANWTAKEHFGLIYLLPNAGNGWIKYGVAFLALDFLDYCYHLIAHRWGAIWKFHLVHHTDRFVDVSTTFREHPGETFIRTCFLIAWVLLCGANLQVLVLRQTVQSLFNILQHTTFRLSPGLARVLGWFFITSNLHHAHHHFKLPGTNCNYGDVFSIWDRMFGTYVDLHHERPVFGLDTHMGEDLSVWHLLRCTTAD